MLIQQILAPLGFVVGMSVEAFLIAVGIVFLVLILTGVLFRPRKQKVEITIVDGEKKKKEPKVKIKVKDKRKKEKETEVVVVTDSTQTETETVVADAVVETEGEAEVTVEEEPKAKTDKKKKKSKGDAEGESDGSDTAGNGGEQESGENLPIADEVVAGADGNSEFEHGDGVIFGENKTVTELYEELSSEQKSFFDELREEALTKPDTELSITKNYIGVKIGKKNLIKLLIKRSVTVAEFMLENEALRQFRTENKNKKGKSAIKVKPTVVQVIDLPSLKVAIDMINLAYEQMMEE